MRNLLLTVTILIPFLSGAQNMEVFYGNDYSDSLVDGFVDSDEMMVMLGNQFDYNFPSPPYLSGDKVDFSVVRQAKGSDASGFAWGNYYSIIDPNTQQEMNAVAQRIIEFGDNYLVVGFCNDEDDSTFAFVCVIDKVSGVLSASYLYDMPGKTYGRAIVAGGGNIFITGDCEYTSTQSGYTRNVWIAELDGNSFGIVNHRIYDFYYSTANKNTRYEIPFDMHYEFNGNGDMLYVGINAYSTVTDVIIAGSIAPILIKVAASSLNLQHANMYTVNTIFVKNCYVNRFKKLNSVSFDLEFGMVGYVECDGNNNMPFFLHLDSQGSLLEWTQLRHTVFNCDNSTNYSRINDFNDYEDGDVYDFLGTTSESTSTPFIYPTVRSFLVTYRVNNTLYNEWIIDEPTGSDYFIRLFGQLGNNMQITVLGNNSSTSGNSVVFESLSNLAYKEIYLGENSCGLDEMANELADENYSHHQMRYEYSENSDEFTSSYAQTEMDVWNGCGDDGRSMINHLNPGDETTCAIYPNPGNGNFVIHFGENVPETLTVRVIDITGKVVYQDQVLSGAEIFNLDFDGAPGLFQVLINGCYYNRALTLQILE